MHCSKHGFVLCLDFPPLVLFQDHASATAMAELVLLTLEARACSESYCCPMCVCVRVCVCMYVHSNLPPHTLESQKRDTNGFIAIQELHFFQFS